MRETDNGRCPQCGAQVPADAPEGLCPRCVAVLNLDPETTLAGRPIQPGLSLKAEQLALQFPELEILEFIGKGGMGAVYKARQKHLDRVVALKILPSSAGSDPAFAERFSREAKALARLNHPGIVTLYEFGNTTEGLYYFLMEFVDGVDLRQLLRSGRVSPREALAIVPQICDALQYAHDQGIVHRDIKPENILMDRRGRVKVADFGLAKIVGKTDARVPHGADIESSVLTDAGKVMGTPSYMSPEQLENPAQVDHRTDIYALGVILYQMLTGEMPSQRIEPPSKRVHIDVRLDEVVLRALEKHPENRYQQVIELKSRVETISTTPQKGAGSDEAIPKFPLNLDPPSGAPSSRRPWLTLSVFVLIAVLLVLWGVSSIRRMITFREASSTSTEFHYRAFEADAELVDALIRASQRMPGVQPGVEFYDKTTDNRPSVIRRGEFTITRIGGLTEAHAARIDLPTLNALLERIHEVPGLLADKRSEVSGVSWGMGHGGVWAYSISRVDKNLLGDGVGTTLLGYHRKGNQELIHIEGTLSHSIDLIQADLQEVLRSRILYEGHAPREGALVFLVPFLRSDGSAHYLVISYEVGRPRSVAP